MTIEANKNRENSHSLQTCGIENNLKLGHCLCCEAKLTLTQGPTVQVISEGRNIISKIQKFYCPICKV